MTKQTGSTLAKEWDNTVYSLLAYSTIFQIDIDGSWAGKRYVVLNLEEEISIIISADDTTVIV